jgi:T5orf172 domain-containing protein
VYALLSEVSQDLQLQCRHEFGCLKSGYLYIIINEAFPGWVKVGTTMDLTSRLHTYQTGDPFRRYKIVFSLQHPEFRQAEKKIKETMKHFALAIKGEWYEVDLGVAKSRLEEQLDEYNGHNAEVIKS